jgi:hypothetical protein
MEAARATQVALWSLAAMALAQLVGCRLGRRAGTAAAAIHAAILVPMWPLAYPHWLAELFAVLGLLLLARRSDWRHDLAGGALLAAALLTIQSLGAPVLFAVVVASSWPGLVQRDWRASLTRPARIALGAAALLGPAVAAFASRGALGPMLDDMFAVTLSQYPRFQAEARSYAANLRELLDVHAALSRPWSWFGAASLAATAALPIAAAGVGTVIAAAAARALASPRAPARPDAATILLAAGCLAAVSPLWLAPSRHDISHIAFLGSFGLIGLSLVPRSSRAGSAEPWAAVLGALLTLVAACGLGSYAAKWATGSSHSMAMGSFRQQVASLGNRYQALPGVYARIAATVPRGESMFFGELGGFHYFYLRRAATSFTLLPVGSQDDFMTQAMWRQAADEIADRRPAIVLLMPYQYQQLLRARPDVFAGYAPEPGYAAYGRFLRRAPESTASHP